MARRGKWTKPHTEADVFDQFLKGGHRAEVDEGVTPSVVSGIVPAWLDLRMVFGLTVVLVLFLADGVRRENREFIVVLTRADGMITWSKPPDIPAQFATVNARFESGTLITTGSYSEGTLEFPDGTTVVVMPNTRFEIRLLEYSRGGRWRSRAFRLAAGGIFVKVSKFLGANSDLRVDTPCSATSVRGTQFFVTYDEATKLSTVICTEGVVEYSSLWGMPVAVVAGSESHNRYGEAPSEPAPTSAMPFPVAPARPDRPWTFVQRAELGVTRVLDVPLSILGIGECSWGLGATDYARRTAAQEAMRLIQVNLEAQAAGYPDSIDPCTMAELGFAPRESKRLTSALDGSRIERYTKRGFTYVLYARARDNARTLYKVGSGIGGVEQVDPEEEASQGL